MDSAIAARWAGGLISVNVAGTIGSGITWAVIGGSGALIVYGLTIGLTAAMVVSGMNATEESTARCRSCKTVLSNGGGCQDCAGRTTSAGRFSGIIDASLAARSSSANATKI